METLPISDGMVEKKYDRKIVVINTDNFDLTNGETNPFLAKMSSPFRDVVAVKLLSFEIRSSSEYSFIAREVFLQINDFRVMTVEYNKNGTQHQRDAFASFYLDAAGIIFSNRDLATTLSLDPYTYIFDPIQSSLDRFNIQIIENDGSIVDTNQFPVKIVLAVYTKRNKFSRI